MCLVISVTSDSRSSAASSMPPIWLYTNSDESNTAMEKICVLYCPVWSYASLPSVSSKIRWYAWPSEERVGMGADQIQRPFVHGFTVGPTLNPASFEAAAPASWFRMKLLPCLARPHTESTPTGPFTARRQSSASSPNVNFFEPSSNRSR